MVTVLYSISDNYGFSPEFLNKYNKKHSLHCGPSDGYLEISSVWMPYHNNYTDMGSLPCVTENGYLIRIISNCIVV